MIEDAIKQVGRQNICEVIGNLSIKFRGLKTLRLAIKG